jgi:hypothetical protein
VSDRVEDCSREINDIRVYGNGIITEAVEQHIRDSLGYDGPFQWSQRSLPLPPLTRRQRLRLKWRDFRWWLGHKIVGSECVEDDW